MQIVGLPKNEKTPQKKKFGYALGSAISLGVFCSLPGTLFLFDDMCVLLFNWKNPIVGVLGLFSVAVFVASLTLFIIFRSGYKKIIIDDEPNAAAKYKKLSIVKYVLLAVFMVVSFAISYFAIYGNLLNKINAIIYAAIFLFWGVLNGVMLFFAHLAKLIKPIKKKNEVNEVVITNEAIITPIVKKDKRGKASFIVAIIASVLFFVLSLLNMAFAVRVQSSMLNDREKVMADRYENFNSFEDTSRSILIYQEGRAISHICVAETKDNGLILGEIFVNMGYDTPFMTEPIENIVPNEMYSFNSFTSPYKISFILVEDKSEISKSAVVAEKIKVQNESYYICFFAERRTSCS